MNVKTQLSSLKLRIFINDRQRDRNNAPCLWRFIVQIADFTIKSWYLSCYSKTFPHSPDWASTCMSDTQWPTSWSGLSSGLYLPSPVARQLFSGTPAWRVSRMRTCQYLHSVVTGNSGLKYSCIQTLGVLCTVFTSSISVIQWICEDHEILENFPNTVYYSSCLLPLSIL